MTNLSDWQPLSRALYRTDPMNTCCQVNNALDEYNRIAMCMVDRVAAGSRLEDALYSTLEDWFGEESLSGRDLSSTLAAIREVL